MTTLSIKCINRSGTPVVLFHGWGFDSQVWDPLLPELTRFFKVYVVDLPGFGLSDSMDWETFKSVLLSTISEPFTAIGWSLGGLYAMRLAIECPQHVQDLVSITATPRFLRAEDWPGEDPALFDLFIARVLANPQETLTNFLRLQSKKPVNFVLKKALNIEALQAGLQILQNWDLRTELHQLRQGQFMFGRLDAIVPFKTYDAMQQQYPQFQYVPFERSAHAPFLSHPALFLKALIHYVR